MNEDFLKTDEKILNNQQPKIYDNTSTIFEFHSVRAKFLNYIIFAILWGFMIAFLVWLANYENDYMVTKKFGDLGFANRLLYVISDYFVDDGYISLTSFAIPLVIVFFEEILIYFKRYFKKSKVFMFVWRTRKYYEYIAMFSWTINMAILIWGGHIIFSMDRGFGRWTNGKSLVTSYENHILAIIMYVVNVVICWTTGIYVIHFLTNKPEFVEGQYWKKCLYLIVISSFLYSQMAFFKYGTQRPLFYNIIWGDLLDDLKERDINAWTHYMEQDALKFGWIIGNPLPGYPTFVNNGYQNLPGKWEWWKVFPGGFLPGQVNPLAAVGGSNFKNDVAFPSGHMQSSLSWAIAMWIYTSQNRKTKFGQTSKYAMIGVGIGYNVIMFSALGFTYGHWMSDMIFTFMVIPLAHFISLGIVRGGILFGNYLDKKIIIYANNFTQKQKEKELEKK